MEVKIEKDKNGNNNEENDGDCSRRNRIEHIKACIKSLPLQQRFSGVCRKRGNDGTDDKEKGERNETKIVELDEESKKKLIERIDREIRIREQRLHRIREQKRFREQNIRHIKRRIKEVEREEYLEQQFRRERNRRFKKFFGWFLRPFTKPKNGYRQISCGNGPNELL